MSKKDMLESVNIWALKQFSWDKYISLADYTYNLNQKLLRYLLKNPQFSTTISNTEKNNIQILIEAIDLSIKRLQSMEERLNE
jgi:hypothetical protein